MKLEQAERIRDMFAAGMTREEVRLRLNLATIDGMGGTLTRARRALGCDLPGEGRMGGVEASKPRYARPSKHADRASAIVAALARSPRCPRCHLLEPHECTPIRGRARPLPPVAPLLDV